MKCTARYFAFVAFIAGISGTATPPALAANGQDFPETTCTCKGCAEGGGDLTGKCPSVCKDKTVYSKGSESHDYCKAKARILTGNELSAALTLGGLVAVDVAKESEVSPSTIRRMVSSGKNPVRAKPETVDKVVHALQVKGVEITEDGVHLAQKPLGSQK
jgi:hypothetical protein